MRDSKFCDSIWPWALAIAPVTRLFSIGTSSGILSTWSTRSTQSDLNSRISSSSQRQVEPGLARVALTAGTTAQLVVDAPRLVALGADDVEAAEVALTSSCSLATWALIFSTMAGQAVS